MDTSGSGTTRDYSNYDWKEVGVTLRITPQINQESLVRLNIYQEVSSVIEVAEDAVGLSTTQSRKAETTVEIKDGETLVIGGLIEKTENKSTYKVPVLGDIPLLGALFRSKSESDIKTNLYIFITPHIIDNSAEAKELTEDKKGYIDAVREGAIRLYEGRSVSEDMRLCNLGYGYLETGDYDRALEYYERALEINPENPYALLNIGYIYEKRGEKEQAAIMYEKLINLDPDERAAETIDNMQLGRKLSDIARDNLENLR
jgi:general secretion pathway protein D